MRAATHAAEPPLEPPGMRDKSHGLCVGKNAEFSFDPPMANSSMFVRPINTASAAFKLAMTVASYGGRKPSKIREAHVVGSPCEQRRSFTATGSPASGPTGLPDFRRLSIASACAIAPAESTRKKGSNGAVVLFDAFQASPRKLGGSDLAGGQLLNQFRRVEAGHCYSPKTAGTK